MQFKLVDLLLILFRHKRIFIINFLLFATIAAAISLFLPFWYRSTARLMPPESQSSDLFGGLTSLISNIPVKLPGLGSLGTGPSDLYLATLRSRNVREGVLRQLDLQAYFEAKTVEDALAMLDNRTFFNKTEEDLIEITCEERSPELAQKMVQAYLEELDRVNREVRRTSASHSREFIETRLNEAERDLQQAAQRIADFQQQHGVIDIENQVKAQITMVADLRGELALLEAEKDFLNAYVAKDHAELKKATVRAQQLQRQIDKLQNGISPIENDLLLSFRNVPELGKQVLFLQRDVEVQKIIYQLLMQQYEQAKIQEAKDSPTIQVLDAPSLAEKRARPKRSLIVLAAGFSSIILSFLLVWGREFLRHLREQDSEKYNRLLAEAKTVHRLRGR